MHWSESDQCLLALENWFCHQVSLKEVVDVAPRGACNDVGGSECLNACCKKFSAIRAFDGSYTAYKRLPSEGLPRFSVQTLHSLPLYIDCSWILVCLKDIYIYILASLDIHRILSLLPGKSGLVLIGLNRIFCFQSS